MAKNFRMVIYKWEGRVTVELAGDIDGSSAAEACYQLEKLRLGECALDFSRVERIDVFGATILARGLKALKGRGIRFEVEALPEEVAEKLCLGGATEALV